jgi:hypothetical protein
MKCSEAAMIQANRKTLTQRSNNVFSRMTSALIGFRATVFPPGLKAVSRKTTHI